jgi:hypothetical protein
MTTGQQVGHAIGPARQMHAELGWRCHMLGGFAAQGVAHMCRHVQMRMHTALRSTEGWSAATVKELYKAFLQIFKQRDAIQS